MKVSIFWFRRDLRLEDNTALFAAVSNKQNVLPIFIFDDDILEELPPDDPRVNFIYDSLRSIDQELRKHDSSLLILKGTPMEVWKNLIQKYDVDSVFINKDYEPYARKRDAEIEQLLQENGTEVFFHKDQVIHEEFEVVKKDGKPYTVYTPYKNKWLEQYVPKTVMPPLKFENFHQEACEFPTMESLGFQTSSIHVRDFDLKNLNNYGKTRDFPGMDTTSHLGPHLRFGTISIRQVIAQLGKSDHVFLSELIWREFFMQILFHFPKVVTQNFRSKYDGIVWLNDPEIFEKWCKGETGYAMVDAGMRELNATGFMHNRVRMITAGFLCKHLLIDWRKGEAYFAKKLLDYELASNNGNWQWAAGTGCDAAPYFRIFNPMTQLKKFDPSLVYVTKWIPEFDDNSYLTPIVEHKFARTRALEAYAKGINN